MTDPTSLTDEQHPTAPTARHGFADDRRGVTAVLGALLMFGLVMLLLVLIQLNAVPAANEEIEFDHNQRVQGDMQELQEAVLLAGTVGREGTVSVETGVGYPTRLFLFNPPRASGVVERTAPGDVTVGNATATGEAGDYLDGDGLSFPSGGLAYRPQYNEFDAAPTTVFENGVLYNDFGDNRSSIQERGALISGRDISVVSLQGSLSTASSRSVALGITPISAPTRTVSVTNAAAGSPLTITVPTRLGPDAWREILDAELAVNGGYVTKIERASAQSVKITLAEDVVYDLRVAAVGVGSGFDRTTPAQYVTTIEGDGATVPEDGTQRLVVEVRDAYNNPVSNETISAEVLGSGFVQPVDTARTDDQGRVTLEYEADGIESPLETVSVQVWLGDGAAFPSDPQRIVEFSLTVFDVDGSGQVTNGGGGGNPLNPGDSVIALNPTLTKLGGNTACSSSRNSNADCAVDVTLKSQLSTALDVTGVRVSTYFAQGDAPPSEFSVENLDSGIQSESWDVGSDFTDDFRAGNGASVSTLARLGGIGDEVPFRILVDPDTATEGTTRLGDFLIFEVRYETGSGSDTTTIAYLLAPS